MSAQRTVGLPGSMVRGWLLALALLTAADAFSADLPPRPSTGPDSTVHDPPTDSTITTATEGKRAREGTKIEATGFFRKTGDRVTFYTDDGKSRYRGLENLMLERIAQKIEDNPGQLQWSITAIVTEYRGANFLLVTHAVLKANGPRVQPGQLTRVSER